MYAGLFWYIPRFANFTNYIYTRNDVDLYISNTMPDPFEKKILDESSEQKTFLTILESMDGITPQHISRQEFNNKCWGFLVDKKDWTHTLYLPTDITIAELPAIIRRVNTLTFGDEVPVYASSEELKVKIVITMHHLLWSVDGIPDRQTHSAVVKYGQLFHQMFPSDIWSLSNKDYRESIINNAKQQKFKEYEEQLLKARTLILLDTLEVEVNRNINEIDDLLAWEVEKWFYESFYERGLSKLALGLQTMTQQNVAEAKKRWWYVDERVDLSELDKKEKLLRKEIGIDAYKKKLVVARRWWNQKDINQLTLEATNAILKSIQKYPYQNDKKFGNTLDEYTPKDILLSKAMYCVWFSLVWSAFLQELGIEHYGLNIPGHSALALHIGNKSLYFDATLPDWWFLRELSITNQKIGEYSQVYIEDVGKRLIQMGDPDSILQSHIYNNKWIDLSDKKQAIVLYDKAIKLNPKSANAYFSKWNALYYLVKDKDAILMYNKAMKLNPKIASLYNMKSIVWKELWNEKFDNLNKLIYNLLSSGEDSRGDFDIYYRTEKSKIRAYIQGEDYDGLAKYMQEIEKND